MTMVSDRPSALALREKWGWFLALGIALVVFGIAAVANLFAATVASVFYIGMLMLVGGLGYLVHAFQVKGWDQTLSWVLSGLLYTFAGILAFWNPALTAVLLTLLMSVALVVAGVFRIWVGIRLRPQRGSGWVMAAGTVTVLAGLVIALGWPVNSLVILGLFLSIDLMMQGWALIALAFAARTANRSSGLK